MWWLVWTVLVLAALAVVGLLGWRLWQQVRALGREASRAGEALGRLDQADDGAAPAPYVPALAAGLPGTDRAHAVRDRVRAERAGQRRARLARATARWRAGRLA
ncbi:hypothetical protein MF406_09100 [Georgenia sp. TF02-10]|uniref:hypothetical protein n=1 Tax=Georgenia sp. TF02-10 TaxID=2917725 RepID=UPI001FA7D302|nr:hypothetical protein [Georgenia sp. TF02-10]UNX53195.1 hypothetical protein MF406_09100 [Georgenia sp. TF02-10]